MAINKKWMSLLWDCMCVLSVVGIWPRFIEPFLLKRSYLKLNVPLLSQEFQGLKIAQLSDLHWKCFFPESLKSKLIKKIQEFQPDFIFFTGDFICKSKLEDPDGLKRFLNEFQASYGCYAVLGNHDYSEFVSVNDSGDYDIENRDSSDIFRGLKRLFFNRNLTGKKKERIKNIQCHRDLENLIKETPFKLLKNQSEDVVYKGTKINICGLEEYSTGRFNPQIAFKEYKNEYPGIILTHNPDSFVALKDYPGDLLLAGHTHGGQVNLPGIWKRLILLENIEFKRGLKKVGNKWGYINRGISSIMNFRWFSIPEVTLIILE